MCIRDRGDLIRIDVPNRQLAIVGVNGEEKTPEEMEAILAQRLSLIHIFLRNWKKPVRALIQKPVQNSSARPNGPHTTTLMALFTCVIISTILSFPLYTKQKRTEPTLSLIHI